MSNDSDIPFGVDGDSFAENAGIAKGMLDDDRVAGFALTVVTENGRMDSHLGLDYDRFPHELFERGELDNAQDFEAMLIGYRIASSFDHLAKAGAVTDRNRYLAHIQRMANVMQHEIMKNNRRSERGPMKEMLKELLGAAVDDMAETSGMADSSSGDDDGDDDDGGDGYHIEVNDVYGDGDDDADV